MHKTGHASAPCCQNPFRIDLCSLGCFRIAIALVLNRYDLLEQTGTTMLEAVHRLGPHWTDAALRIQRNGW